MALKSNGGPGWQAAIARLQQKVEKGTQVSVGFFDNATYPDGTSVAQVAAWNEFGTNTSPPRPFMRNAVADNKAGWPKLMAETLKEANYDVDKALALCGERIGAQIQQAIITIDGPANSPLTNLLKWRFPKGGYSTKDFLKAIHDIEKEKTAKNGKPLVWSGLMLQSVSYEIKGQITKLPPSKGQPK